MLILKEMFPQLHMTVFKPIIQENEIQNVFQLFYSKFNFSLFFFFFLKFGLFFHFILVMLTSLRIDVCFQVCGSLQPGHLAV